MIYLYGVSTFEEHFWSHVFWRPTKTIGKFVWSGEFRESEIRDTNMPIQIEKYVFRFDVTVHDSHLVQVQHADADFHKVKLSLLLWHSLEGFELIEEFSSATELEYKYNKVATLKGKEHLDCKRMMDECHDVSFILEQFCFLVLDDELFVYQFHGIEVTVHFWSHQVDLWESTRSNAFQNLKVLKWDMLSC